MLEVPLANGRGVVVVDDEDVAAVSGYSWYLHEVKGKTYARTKHSILMHRLLAGLQRGDGLEVDHIDGDGLNNRRSNLRVVTHAQNHQNRGKGYGRSEYRGVSWWSTRSKWTVRVKVGGVNHHGGNFDDEHEAGRAAQALRARLMPYTTN